MKNRWADVSANEGVVAIARCPRGPHRVRPHSVLPITPSVRSLAAQPASQPQREIQADRIRSARQGDANGARASSSSDPRRRCRRAHHAHTPPSPPLLPVRPLRSPIGRWMSEQQRLVVVRIGRGLASNRLQRLFSHAWIAVSVTVSHIGRSE